MKPTANMMPRWALGLLLAVAAASGPSGCEDSEYDRDPPDGQGSLVVDNFTGDRLRVYVDGERLDSVKAGHHRYYDLEPGVHRLALDGDDTDRSWADDVDVLENRRTVIEVRSQAGDYREFDVRVYFD